jgi:hypothetical protein
MFWGLWSDLPIPNLLVPFGAGRLAEIERALGEHAGELERNRFDQLLRGRATVQAVLGPERLFGFGVRGGAYEYAELLTAVRFSSSAGWRLAAGGEFDPNRPLSGDEGAEIGWWLHAPSVRSLVASATTAAAGPARRAAPESPARPDARSDG